jgi:lysophospholipase L1-like esterase
VAFTRIDQTDGSVTLGGGHWGSAVVDTNAVSGSYAKTTTNGDTATIVIPSGPSTVILQCTRLSTGGTPTIVNSTTGSTPVTWDQTSGTSNAAAAWVISKSCSPPIALNPAVANTIVVTAAGGGATLDAYEKYTPSAITAGRLTVAGHSIPAGAIIASPTTNRFTALAAAWLGMTEDNTGAATGATIADNNQAASPVPLWTIIHVGTNWDQRTPEIALCMIGINDISTLLASDPTAGYYLALFKQRLRELVWRMNYSVPGALVALVGMTPNTNIGGAVTVANIVAWDRAIQQVALEPTMTNCMYVNVWDALNNNGYTQTSVLSDGTHPTIYGHELMARALFKQLSARRSLPPAVRLVA